MTHRRIRSGDRDRVDGVCVEAMGEPDAGLKRWMVDGVGVGREW
jgi:hypothetical protein